MAEELPKALGLVEPTKIDTAASDSCTRSGTFALLLSLALISLIPFWLQEREEIALGQYVELRLNLAASIENLDTNPQWQRYKTSHEGTELLSIEQLLKVSIESPIIEANTSQVPSLPPTTNEDENQQDTTPKLAAPKGFHIRLGKEAAGTYEIHQIAEFIVALNDSNLLTTSSTSSSFYNYSIFRWVLKQRNLTMRNMFVSDPTLVVSYGTEEKSSDLLVNTLDKEELLNNLTLRDVGELAQFELPKIPDNTKFVGRYGKEVEIVLGSLPRNLYMASAFAEVLLLFVIMYFYAFAREAISSAMFPTPGTLFSAFSSSSLTLVVFLIALWTPVVASLGVAVASRKLLLSVLGVLIGCAVLSVHIVFQHKAYFKALNLRLLVHH